MCRSKCNVKRNDYGPTCFAAAVAKKYRYHDHFFCPHTDEGWHRQALDLVLALEKTPAKRIKELIRMDLKDLLKEKAKYFSAK